jgi:hypothetical protein
MSPIRHPPLFNLKKWVFKERVSPPFSYLKKWGPPSFYLRKGPPFFYLKKREGKGISFFHGMGEKIIPILIYLPNFFSAETEDWDPDSPSHSLSIYSKRRSYHSKVGPPYRKSECYGGESGKIDPNPHLSLQVFIAGE